MKFFSFLILALLSFNIFAAKITDPVLNVGPGAGDTFTIQHKDGGYLKKDGGQGDWFFSNDGVLEKKIGSGSGSGGDGGVNVLPNSTFEDGLLNWTSSGGTFSQQSYTNALETNLKYARFISTTPGEFVESDCIDKPDAISGGGMADIRYLGGANFDLKVIDCTTSDVEISTGTLGEVTEWLKAPTQTFSLPAKLKIKLISTAAGSIDFDTAYLGSNKNISPVGKMSHFVGNVSWQGGNGCVWSRSSSVYGNFSPNTLCDDNPRVKTGTTNITGIDINNTDGQLPQIILSNVQKGEYVFIINGSIVDEGPSYSCFFRVSDGEYSSVGSDVYAATGANYSGGVTSRVSIPVSGGTRAFNIQSSSLGESCTVYLNSAERQLDIAVYYYPTGSDTQEAFTPEQANFFVSAKIFNDTASNITLPTVSRGPITSSGLTLEQVSGSSKIACSTGDSGGGTCLSGNELSGITVNLPVAGKYKVCSAFPIDHGNTNITMSLVHTENSNDNIIIDSKITDTRIHSPDVAAEIATLKLSTCEIFDIASVGEKTFKAFFFSPSGTTRQFRVRNGATSGEIMGTFTVELVQNNVANPVILNMVDTSVKSGVRENSCRINNNGTAVTDLSSGLCESWIQSVSRVGLGHVSITTIAGSYSKNPICVVSNSVEGSTIGNKVAVNSSSNFEVRLFNTAGSLLDENFLIICMGAR